MKRTHKNGTLNKEQIGKKVMLAGWVNARRDHGGIIFIEIRDRYGITQVVFNPEKPFFKEADKLRNEDVIQISGEVVKRPKGMVNENLNTGEIEVVVDKLTVLNKSKTPKIEVDDRANTNDAARMRWRYLDLRKPNMQKKLRNRAKAMKAARNYLDKQDFLELETPMLIRSTPEGARDYVVPSRVHPGKVYSLPQSPQLYKQLLMVSGFDRYYQFARCLRDEDLRSDRQPEFTQLDLEMSFVEKEDVFEIIEGITKEIWKNVLNQEIKEIPKITYHDSMNKYGNDKPDLRIPWHLQDVTKLMKNSDLKIFQKAQCVKMLHVPEQLGSKEVRRYESEAKKVGAKGMAWLKLENKELQGPIAKFLKQKEQQELIKKSKMKEGEFLLFIADRWENACEILGHLRVHIYKKYHELDKSDFKFAWITDYPLFEYDHDEKKWNPMHHIFSHPTKETIKHLESNPGKVKSDLYDFILNGYELGSGSIRIHNTKMQQEVMDVIGLSLEDAKDKFGFLLEALEYGAPPHGGFAIGFDRMMALMNQTRDIREVITFPKNKQAENPMDGCPTPADKKMLEDYGLQLNAAGKANLKKH